MSRRSIAASLPCLVIASFAKADLYDDYINSRSRQPFVSFFARTDTVTGHAFVAVGTELDNGLTVYEGIFGYYPAGGAQKFKKLLVSDKGVVTFKENDYPSKIKFRRNVDDANKKAALEVFKTWSSADPKYNLLALGGKNCNSLVMEVASAIGLNLPSESPGTVFPEKYISDLRDGNQP